MGDFLLPGEDASLSAPLNNHNPLNNTSNSYFPSSSSSSAHRAPPPPNFEFDDEFTPNSQRQDQQGQEQSQHSAPVLDDFLIGDDDNNNNSDQQQPPSLSSPTGRTRAVTFAMDDDIGDCKDEFRVTRYSSITKWANMCIYLIFLIAGLATLKTHQDDLTTPIWLLIIASLFFLVTVAAQPRIVVLSKKGPTDRYLTITSWIIVFPFFAYVSWTTSEPVNKFSYEIRHWQTKGTQDGGEVGRTHRTREVVTDHRALIIEGVIILDDPDYNDGEELRAALGRPPRFVEGQATTRKVCFCCLW